MGKAEANSHCVFRRRETLDACFDGSIDDSLLRFAAGVGVHGDEAEDGVDALEELDELLFVLVGGLHPSDAWEGGQLRGILFSWGAKQCVSYVCLRMDWYLSRLKSYLAGDGDDFVLFGGDQGVEHFSCED